MLVLGLTRTCLLVVESPLPLLTTNTGRTMNDGTDAPVVEEKKAESKPVGKKAAAKKNVKEAPAKRSKKPVTRRRPVEKVAKKEAKRKAFPYVRVAKLWAKGRTVTEIAKATGYFNSTSDDPCHRLRVALTAMHRGWKDSNGKTHKLPHRVSKNALKAATRAGKKAARG